MKMNSIALFVMVVALIGATVVAYAKDEKSMPVAKAKMASSQTVYVCPECNTMSLTAGNCPSCNKPLVAMHVLGTKDGKVMVCACGPTCKCDAKGMKDGKCACGKEVKTISAKGMYVCPKGCPMVSETAGKCACGMDLKKVE